MQNIISLNNLAILVGVSRATVSQWVACGKIIAHKDAGGRQFCYLNEIADIEQIRAMLHTKWYEELETKPLRTYTSVELFAGAGGLALGLSKAGFSHIALNEYDKDACATLRFNRPEWNVLEGDIHDLEFSSLRGRVDMLSGGFPCQAFSYAGKRLGFEEARGTLFFEMARVAQDIQPLVWVGENVRGLLEHNKGQTLKTIKKVIAELGYTLVEPRVLRAVQYNVPQKRERLFLIAIRNDIAPYVKFEWPGVCDKLRTLRDAFYKGELFPSDVPASQGQKYPAAKISIMKLVPEGGDWRDLPPDIAREYMKGSYELEGGRTGMARRLALDEPSLTLTCAPAQKQTERCHPFETRPLTIREYARIQTFPDDWTFQGSLSSQYKQIGNAVPVNLAWAVGRSLVRLLNDIYALPQMRERQCPVYDAVTYRLPGLFEGLACDPLLVNYSKA